MDLEADPCIFNFVFLFELFDNDLADTEAYRIEISAHQRNNPLDKLVTELMIVANNT